MNSNFRDFVTQTAFDLKLSKRMIVTLVIVMNDDYWEEDRVYSRDIYACYGAPEWYVPGIKALNRRGLVYAPDKKQPGIVKLTKAGELVVELLKEAGLIQKVIATNENAVKKAKRKTP